MRLLLCLSLLLFFNCANSKSQKFFLTLQSDFSAPNKQSINLPIKIQIKDIDAGKLADNPNIVIRKTDNSVSFDRSAEWAIRPSSIFTEILESTIKSTISCNIVKRRFLDSSPDLFVSGSIVSIEDDKRGNDRSVRLIVRLQLTKNNSDFILFEKEYLKSSNLSNSDNYSNFAFSLNKLMVDVANSFSSDISPLVKSATDESKHSSN